MRSQPEFMTQRLAAAGMQRPMPAWLLSTGLHAVVLILLVLVFRAPTKTTDPEPPRAAGIVLAEHSQDVAYFSPEETQADESQSESQAAAGSSGANSALPSSAAASVENRANASPELPGEQEIAAANSGLLQDIVASGSGRGSILPGLGDAEILANDPLLNAPPQPELGPTATMKIFGTSAVGRSFVLLIDRSKSMGGDGLGAIEAAEKELSRALGALSPAQTFQIVAYNQRLSANDDTLIPATNENKTLAAKFMAGIVAHGQTEHRMAILAALRNKPEVIYVFTDAGEPPLTQPDIQMLTLRADRKTVIHCVQFGFGPLQDDDPYLQKLARLNGGSYAYVDVSRSGNFK
jgi:hypothetical protein